MKNVYKEINAYFKGKFKVKWIKNKKIIIIEEIETSFHNEILEFLKLKGIDTESLLFYYSKDKLIFQKHPTLF